MNSYRVTTTGGNSFINKITQMSGLSVKERGGCDYKNTVTRI